MVPNLFCYIYPNFLVQDSPKSDNYRFLPDHAGSFNLSNQHVPDKRDPWMNQNLEEP